MLSGRKVIIVFMLFVFSIQLALAFDFNPECAACHGSRPKYPVAGAAESYEFSGHKLGFDRHSRNAWYANGNGCQQCHTNEGFLEYLDTGAVEGYVDYPSQIGCASCHDYHATGDFSLNTTAPVTLANDAVFDMGTGNLCANCHRARRSAEAIVVPTAANAIRAHWGAHHGPQADILAGKNGYEFSGKRYTSSIHTRVIRDSCVDCHLARPEGRYGLSSAVGGHSFYLKGDVHGSDRLNIAACSGCHSDVSQEGEHYSISAKGDYDNDGTVETAQAEIEGMLELLVNDRGTGVLQKLDPPVYNRDGSWNATRSERVRTEAEMGAIYNYKFVEEDRSLGIHNTKYAGQLLHDSIKALDPRFRGERP